MWQATPTPNLVRYLPKGSYYLRARIKGRIVRESLHTTNYRVACNKLSDRLRDLRALCGATGELNTLHDALPLLRAKIENDPSLKTSTKTIYLMEMQALERGAKSALPFTAMARLTEGEMQRWWSGVARIYAPQRANHMLMFARWLIEIAERAGAIASDPTRHLKRVYVPRKRLTLLSPAELRLVTADIRSRGKPWHHEAADWIEFMAYSGMRPMEIDALQWSHIDEASGFIVVIGGKEGTKNREVRRVPILPPMKALLKQMRGDGHRSGNVFNRSKPAQVFRAACARLKMPRQRIYDLRHLFATVCCQSNVPVPMFAGWMGHKDGGTLALKTYVQKNDEYSRAIAQKVTFE